MWRQTDIGTHSAESDRATTLRLRPGTTRQSTPLPQIWLRFHPYSPSFPNPSTAGLSPSSRASHHPTCPRRRAAAPLSPRRRRCESGHSGGGPVSARPKLSRAAAAPVSQSETQRLVASSSRRQVRSRAAGADPAPPHRTAPAHRNRSSPPRLRRLRSAPPRRVPPPSQLVASTASSPPPSPRLPAPPAPPPDPSRRRPASRPVSLIQPGARRNPGSATGGGHTRAAFLDKIARARLHLHRLLPDDVAISIEIGSMGSSVQRDSISAQGSMEGVDCPGSSRWARMMSTDSWRWCLGLIYIVAVASIWIAASYIVQSVVDAGVSPFLITYICNSLFVIYIPIVEVARYFEDSINNFWTKLKGKNGANVQLSADLESVNLLQRSELEGNATSDQPLRLPEDTLAPDANFPGQTELTVADCSKGLDAKGRWTRARVARVSMVVCPFWFLAQLTFNLSLRYTTVTSNTILSSTSSLFTFLVALVFLGETFTWLKLISVLLCMGGTIIVSLADSSSTVNAIATNPLLGDILSIVSAGLYAVYITLIRKKFPDEKEGQGQVSMAQFLGFLGLFNMLFFLPVALVLNFAKLEPFHRLTWEQVALIVGKGLLDNVLSDYLWAQAILLTTTTVATAGLTIQVPIAAIVDTLTGHAPHLLNYIGAAAVLVGFAGINIPSDTPRASQQEQETPIVSMVDDPLHFPGDRNSTDAVS